MKKELFKFYKNILLIVFLIFPLNYAHADFNQLLQNEIQKIITEEFNAIEHITKGDLYKKAKNGSESAIFQIGLLHNLGAILEKDESKALKLYIKAAEKGYRNAQFFLGMIYLNGLAGENIDYNKATMYHNQAAKQGNLASTFYMAYIYIDEKNSSQC